MLLRVPAVLPPAVASRIRALVDAGDWGESRAAVGGGEGGYRQLEEDGKAARAARAIVVDCLGQSAPFFTAALPKKIYPPMFSRYEGRHNRCASHVDEALQTWNPTGTQIRADIAATLFLSDPHEYEGGELVIEDTQGAQSFKLRAGELMLYPPSRLHRVEPVTRGTRLASFFWIESMVREDERRRLLYELDMATTALRSRHGDSAELVRLGACYYNLMRLWANV